MSALGTDGPEVVVTGAGVLSPLADLRGGPPRSPVPGRERPGAGGRPRDRRRGVPFAGQVRGFNPADLPRPRATSVPWTAPAGWPPPPPPWPSAAGEAPAADDPGPIPRRSGVGLVLGTMFGSVRTIAEFDRRALTAGPELRQALRLRQQRDQRRGRPGGDLARPARASTPPSPAAPSPASRPSASRRPGGGRRGAEALLAGRRRRAVASRRSSASPAAACCADSNGHAGDPRPVPFDARSERLRARARGRPCWCSRAPRTPPPRGADGPRPRARERRRLRPLARRATRPPAPPRWRARCAAALAAAGLAPDAIDCLAAGGSGSRALDAREAAGVAEALGERAATLPVAAVKSMLGEALGASGRLPGGRPCSRPSAPASCPASPGSTSLGARLPAGRRPAARRRARGRGRPGHRPRPPRRRARARAGCRHGYEAKEPEHGRRRRARTRLVRPAWSGTGYTPDRAGPHGRPGLLGGRRGGARAWVEETTGCPPRPRRPLHHPERGDARQRREPGRNRAGTAGRRGAAPGQRRARRRHLLRPPRHHRGRRRALLRAWHGGAHALGWRHHPRSGWTRTRSRRSSPSGTWRRRGEFARRLPELCDRDRARSPKATTRHGRLLRLRPHPRGPPGDRRLLLLDRRRPRHEHGGARDRGGLPLARRGGSSRGLSAVQRPREREAHGRLAPRRRQGQDRHRRRPAAAAGGARRARDHAGGAGGPLPQHHPRPRPGRLPGPQRARRQRPDRPLHRHRPGRGERRQLGARDHRDARSTPAAGPPRHGHPAVPGGRHRRRRHRPAAPRASAWR